MPKKPRQPKPKPPPYWERPPRPVAGGVEIIGRCHSGQGIPLFIEDIVTKDVLFAASYLRGHGIPCRHCGRPYQVVRARRRFAQAA